MLQAGTGHGAQWTIAANEIEMPTVGQTQEPKNGIPVGGIILGLGIIFGLTVFTAYIRKRKK